MCGVSVVHGKDGCGYQHWMLRCMRRAVGSSISLPVLYHCVTFLAFDKSRATTATDIMDRKTSAHRIRVLSLVNESYVPNSGTTHVCSSHERPTLLNTHFIYILHNT